MNEEPSLLDYLKSLLDPRRERIRLPETGEQVVTPVEIDREETLQATAESMAVVIPESGPGEAATGHPADVRPATAAEVITAPAPEPELRGPFPWRTLAALALALIAQSAFEPPERSLTTGLWLYGAAVIVATWAFWTGELKMAARQDEHYDQDDLVVRRTFIYVAILMIAFAFIVLSNNKFTSFNLAAWFAALGLLFWSFYRSGQINPFELRQLLPPYRITITRWGLLVLLVAGTVLFFRFYRLAQVPPQMFSDHAEKLQDVQDVLNGETRIFFPRNTGREFVQMYLTAFTAQVLGYGLTFMALKMGTALAGLVTLLYIYLLGVELANRRVGLLAVLLAGTSYWLNVITRVALRFSLYPLFVAPVLFYVIRGLRRGRRNDFIWAGIFLGLGLHGYSPFRFVPLLVVAIVVLFILHAGSNLKRRQAFWHLGVVVAISFVVFLPLLRFMTESEANRSIFLYRSLTRIGTVETPYPGNPVAILTENMGRAMSMFAWDNGNTWVHSIVFRPALDVVSAALFYLGYVLLLARYVRRRRWEDAALLISVPFLLLPSAMSLAFPSENPSLNRTGGAIIPVFLVVALLLDAVMRVVRRWIGGDWGRVISWGFAGFLLFWSLGQNYDLVFHQYSDQFTQASWNTTELGGVIRGFADSIGSEDAAWVIPYPHWVDTRLVGINAGVYIRDYAIPREQLFATVNVPGPKLFLFNMQDVDTMAELENLYPGGSFDQYISDVPGKDFMIFLVPVAP